MPLALGVVEPGMRLDGSSTHGVNQATLGHFHQGTLPHSGCRTILGARVERCPSHLFLQQPGDSVGYAVSLLLQQAYHAPATMPVLLPGPWPV